MITPHTVKMLKRTVAFIRKYPETYDQVSIGIPYRRRRAVPYGGCGCLFAVAHLLTLTPEEQLTPHGFCFYVRGAKALGLPVYPEDALDPEGAEMCARRLYFYKRWPRQFQAARITVEMAAARVAHFIATGGDE